MNQDYKSVRIFENPFLESFSHVHPATPVVLFLPIALLLFGRAALHGPLGASGLTALALFGFLSWTFVEYVLHRYLFHYTNDLTKKIFFRIHGFHHVDASDPTRLVMTPMVSIPLGLLFYGFFQLLMPRAWVDPFFAFFLVGYICYDMLHFYVHFYSPKNKAGRWLKEHHMKHHFLGRPSRWGVSSPLWDIIFGTL